MNSPGESTMQVYPCRVSPPPAPRPAGECRPARSEAEGRSTGETSNHKRDVSRSHAGKCGSESWRPPQSQAKRLVGRQAHAVPGHLAASAAQQRLSTLRLLVAGVADRGRLRCWSARHGGPKTRGATSRSRRPLYFRPSCRRLARSLDLRRRAVSAGRNLESESSCVAGAARWLGTACVPVVDSDHLASRR